MQALLHGAEKLTALGRYPDVPFADARVGGDAARKQLGNGIDPIAERIAEKTSAEVAKEKLRQEGSL